jgi:hypothetical protein
LGSSQIEQILPGTCPALCDCATNIQKLCFKLTGMAGILIASTMHVALARIKSSMQATSIHALVSLLSTANAAAHTF